MLIYYVGVKIQHKTVPTNPFMARWRNKVYDWISVVSAVVQDCRCSEPADNEIGEPRAPED